MKCNYYAWWPWFLKGKLISYPTPCLDPAFHPYICLEPVAVSATATGPGYGSRVTFSLFPGADTGPGPAPIPDPDLIFDLNYVHNPSHMYVRVYVCARRARVRVCSGPGSCVHDPCMRVAVYISPVRVCMCVYILHVLHT